MVLNIDIKPYVYFYNKNKIKYNNKMNIVSLFMYTVFVKSLHLLVVPGLSCACVLVARENVTLHH